jgi:hypothetical protein
MPCISQAIDCNINKDSDSSRIKFCVRGRLSVRSDVVFFMLALAKFAKNDYYEYLRDVYFTTVLILQLLS